MRRVSSWKFQKILSMRKNVWEVGDKRCKELKSIGINKRNESLNVNDDV